MHVLCRSSSPSGFLPGERSRGRGLRVRRVEEVETVEAKSGSSTVKGVERKTSFSRESAGWEQRRTLGSEVGREREVVRGRVAGGKVEG